MVDMAARACAQGLRGSMLQDHIILKAGSVFIASVSKYFLKLGALVTLVSRNAPAPEA